MESTWPWIPFLFTCISRAFYGLWGIFLIESQVAGLAPVMVRWICFYGAAAALLTSFIRQVLSVFTAGPTPDLRVRVQQGSFKDHSVSWLAADLRGWRENMEDAYVVEELRKDLFGDALLFAVLDGHGGAEVSALASKLLAPEMEAQRKTSAELDEVLRESFPRVDERLRRGWGLGWLFPGPLHPFSTCGSTCVAAAVDLERREVVVANIGDSRALLLRDGKAMPLSDDHKPENPIERKRIRAAGGQVLKIGGCHRVDGNLNLSRAFGDFNLKAAALPPEKQKVIAVPDLTKTNFGEPNELLVLACDGLFERHSNQDIANMIWPKFKMGMGLEQIATEVLHQCCARSLRGRPIEEGTDNETIILVRLPRVEEPALPVGQRVRVQNLTSENAALNGLEGVVEGAAGSGRYSVRLGDLGLKSMKLENLMVLEDSPGPG